jgi:hypothetical protein
MITPEILVEREVICCISTLICELRDCPKFAEEEDYITITCGNDEEAEIYEQWVVTPYLGEKLAAHGEAVVYDFLGFPAIWGRTTSGQMRAMDSIIEKICHDINNQ